MTKTDIQSTSSPVPAPPQQQQQQQQTKSSPASTGVSPTNMPSKPSRKTSVHFSSSPPLSPKNTSPKDGSPPPQHSSPNDRAGTEPFTSTAAAESSGDEITPIMQRERGGGRGRGYDGVSTAAAGGGVGDQSKSMKRRKSNKNTNKKKRRKGTGQGQSDEESESDGEEGEDGEEEDKESRSLARWVKGVAEKYGSVELDNKGSVARDHLALERTFLAWLRTSLAFASIGIAITQLFRLNTTISERDGLTPDNPANSTFHLKQVGKPLGATFLGIAIVVLLLGGRRYFESQYWIIRGKFPASRGSVFLVTGIAVALIVTSLVVVCVVDPSVFEKKR